MGYSISWIAIRDCDPETVLEQLKLRRTGQADEALEAPFSCGISRNWFIVAANNCDWADAQSLSRLSRHGQLVACALEEHIMASGACEYRGGRMRWRLTHDCNRGLWHLAVKGTLPRGFKRIRRSLETSLRIDGGEQSEVDYLCDAPIEMAAKVTGFRHDRSSGNLFEKLRPTAQRARR